MSQTKHRLREKQLHLFDARFYTPDTNGPINHMERELQLERQQRFLHQSYGEDAARLSEEHYRVAFLILPYLVLENDDNNKMANPVTVNNRLDSLYRYLAGEHPGFIAARNGSKPDAIKESRKKFASFVAKTVSLDELIATTIRVEDAVAAQEKPRAQSH